MSRRVPANGNIAQRRVMRSWFHNTDMMMRLTFAVGLVVAVLSAQIPPSLAEQITCSSPVAADDSARSLKLRHGAEATIEDGLSTGVEDITYRGLVLHPGSPEWRIEIAFTDEAMERVSYFTLVDAKTSHWSVAGVTLGATLAEVQSINGKPFLMREFFTDAGGFVIDWRGGVLGRPLPGGCTITLRFGKRDDTKAPIGDRISSDNARLLKWQPVVEQVGVNFPTR